MVTGAKMKVDVSHIRTVVVDNSPLFLRTVGTFLAQCKGVDVVATATNASEALTAVDKLKPDLVLLDYQMPLVNGITAMEQIHRRSPATRVVILTGHDVPELRRASLEGGAFAFIPKLGVSRELPFLIARIASTLEATGSGVACGVSLENGQVLFSRKVCFCPLQVQGHSFAIDENNAAIDQLLAGAVILLIAGQRGERHHKLH